MHDMYRTFEHFLEVLHTDNFQILNIESYLTQISIFGGHQLQVNRRARTAFLILISFQSRNFDKVKCIEILRLFQRCTTGVNLILTGIFNCWVVSVFYLHTLARR